MMARVSQTVEARRDGRVLAAVAATLALTGYGFWSGRLWRQEIWQAPGGERFLIFLGVACVWFGGWIVGRPSWLAPATFCLAAAYSVAAVGALPVGAAAFFLLASWALGRWLLAGLSGAPAFLALLTGLGVFLWLGSWLAHAPLNYTGVWLALLAVPLVARPQATAACLREAAGLVRPVVLRSRLEYAALAVALVPLLAQWLVTLKPEVSTDALSMHLVVPAYMADHHLWSFDFRHFAWAVMPMGGVWGYSIAYLLGGEFAARLLNFALLAGICGFVYTAARRWTGRPMAFLVAGLFASMPVVQLVTGSLFVETFYAAFVAGALGALWRHHETGERGWLAAAAFLLGSAMAVKLLALPFVAIAGAVLVWELAGAWREGGKRWAPMCAAVFLAAAVLPYVYAWRTTGNPVFPFENQWFRSPYYAPVATPETRFHEPLTWRTPFDMTFETHRYWEGQDGSLGFHLLLLGPLLLPWGWRRWKFGEWSLWGVAVGGAFLEAALEPNVRYLYPALPLLTLAMAPELEAGAMRRWIAPAVVLWLGLNLWFLPSSSWYHKTFCLNPWERGAAGRYLASAAPVRLLVDYLNRAHPWENVLFLETGDIAQLRGRAYTNGWHSYLFMQRAGALRSADEALELAHSLGIRHFVYPDPARGVAVRESLWKELIERCATIDGGAPSGLAFRLANLGTCRADTGGAAGAGAYDDLDERISYVGLWSHDGQFAEAAHHSVTYSDAPGAAFRLVFHGTSVTWIYTRAANRGMAEVRLDGAPRGEVDLYAPATAWQSRSVFRAGAAGDHTLEVRLLNRHNPRSSGDFVDVDEVVVE